MNYLSITGLSFDFIGAIVLALGLIKTKKQIEEESGTYWDVNLSLKKSMYRDRNLAIAGLAIIAFGFLLQIIGQL